MRDFSSPLSSPVFPLKKALILVLSVLLVLIFSASAALKFYFDPIALEKNLQEKCLKETGHTLRFEAASRLLLLPFPSVELGPLTVSGEQPNQPLLRLKRVRMGLALGALFDKKVDISRLEIEEGVLTLTHRENGTWDLGDLLKLKQEGETRFEPESVVIQNSRVIIQDKTLEKTLDFSQLNGEAESPFGVVPGTLTLKGRLLQAQSHTDIGFQVKSGVQLERFSQRIRLNKVDVQAKGQSGELKNALFRMTGHFDFQPEAQTHWIQQLILSASMQQEARKIALRLEIPTIQFLKQTLHSPSLRFVSTSDDAWHHIRLTTDLEGFAGNQDKVNIQSVKSHFNWQHDQDRFDFRLKSPARWIDHDKLQLDNLQAETEFKSRRLPRGIIRATLKGALEASTAHQSAELNAQGQLDNGKVTLNLNWKSLINPIYTLQLRLGKVDLTRYLPEPDPNAKNEENLGAGLLSQKDIPLDFTWLKGLNLSALVSVNELTLAKFKMQQLQFNIRANHEHLTLEPFANVYQGRLQGSFRVNAQVPEPIFSLKQHLKGMNVTPLLKDTLGLRGFEGQGNLDIDLNATGNSLAKVRSSVAGKVAVGLTQGAIRGVDIGQLLREARAKITNSTPQPAPVESKTQKDKTLAGQPPLADKTEFQKLSASLVLNNGLIQNEDLTLSSPILAITGKGNMDLAANKIDYTMTTHVIGKTGVPELDSIVGIAVPIKLTGALASPTFSLDFNTLVGKTKAEPAPVIQGQPPIQAQPAAPLGTLASDPNAPKLSPAQQALQNHLRSLLK